MIAIVLLARGGASSYPSSANLAMARRVLLVGYFVIAAIYFAAFESSPMQGTPGKRLLGIKVVDRAGARIGFRRAIARWLAAGLSWLSLGVGFLTRRMLHDHLAGSDVVDRWAYSATPERQRAPGLVQKAFAAATMLFVLFAFVASSQYSDYVVRSEVSEGLSLADSVKSAMAEYQQAHGAWPASNAELGLPETVAGSYVGRLDVGERPGRIAITYSSRPPQHAHPMLDGRRLYLDAARADGVVGWTCHSETLRQADCPSSCACSW